MTKKVHALLLLGALLLFGAWIPSTNAQEYSWEAVYSLIEHRYPNIPTIDIHTAQQWQSNPKILWIDVREQNEFQIGHIKGAKNWTKEEEFSLVHKDTQMVLYCSVGYRSAKLVHELNSLGYTRVHNLKGSIFAWANAGYFVYRGATKVQSVHPYNALWGQLLYKRYHKVSL